MAVHLYALSTCPYCRMTKKYLDENEVTYEMIEVDLLEGTPDNPDTPKGAAAEVKRLSGGTSFPVLVAGDDVVVGFNKGRIAQVLGL